MKKAWSEENWRNWLQSCHLDREVSERLRTRLDGARNEIRRAWQASLGLGCIAATLTALVIAWPTQERWNSGSETWIGVLADVLVANAVALLVWLAARWLAIRSRRFGDKDSSLEYLSYKVTDDLAADCGTAALEACTVILHRRETRLAGLEEESTRETTSAVQRAISAAWKEPSLLELEARMLAVFAGGRFIEAGPGLIQAYKADVKCARCKKALLSHVHSLAIEPQRAESAGLVRSNAMPERPAKRYFLGKREQFEQFFRRPCADHEGVLIGVGGLDYEFCAACASDGEAANVLYVRPAFVVEGTR